MKTLGRKVMPIYFASCQGAPEGTSEAALYSSGHPSASRWRSTTEKYQPDVSTVPTRDRPVSPTQPRRTAAWVSKDPDGPDKMSETRADQSPTQPNLKRPSHNDARKTLTEQKRARQTAKRLLLCNDLLNSYSG